MNDFCFSSIYGNGSFTCQPRTRSFITSAGEQSRGIQAPDSSSCCSCPGPAGKAERERWASREPLEARIHQTCNLHEICICPIQPSERCPYDQSSNQSREKKRLDRMINFDPISTQNETIQTLQRPSDHMNKSSHVIAWTRRRGARLERTMKPNPPYTPWLSGQDWAPSLDA